MSWLAEKYGVPPPKFKIRKVGTSELKQETSLLARLGLGKQDTAGKGGLIKMVGFPDDQYDNKSRTIVILRYEDKQPERKLGSNPVSRSCHEFCHYWAHSKRDWRHDRTREEFNEEEVWAEKYGHELYAEYLRYLQRQSPDTLIRGSSDTLGI